MRARVVSLRFEMVVDIVICGTVLDKLDDRGLNVCYSKRIVRGLMSDFPSFI